MRRRAGRRVPAHRVVPTQDTAPEGGGGPDAARACAAAVQEQFWDLDSDAEPLTYSGGPGPEFDIVVTADQGERTFNCQITRTDDAPVRWEVVEVAEIDHG